MSRVKFNKILGRRAYATDDIERTGKRMDWPRDEFVSDRPKLISAEVSAEISAEISVSVSVSVVPAETETTSHYLTQGFHRKKIDFKVLIKMQFFNFSVNCI